jgi:hypothetical protein
MLRENPNQCFFLGKIIFLPNAKYHKSNAKIQESKTYLFHKNVQHLRFKVVAMRRELQ